MTNSSVYEKPANDMLKQLVANAEAIRVFIKNYCDNNNPNNNPAIPPIPKGYY
jgi:hypothetical protein